MENNEFVTVDKKLEESIEPSNGDIDIRDHASHVRSNDRGDVPCKVEVEKLPDVPKHEDLEVSNQSLSNVRQSSPKACLPKAKSTGAQSSEKLPASGEDSGGKGGIVADGEDSGELTGFPLYVVLAGIGLAVFLVMLNTSMITTAIPQITNYFGSIADVGYYGSVYLLANCTVQPLSGKLYTHNSLKKTYLCFIALFELGSLICGLATSSNMLIVGRAIAGTGSAGIVNGSLTIIAHAAPMNKRPLYIGIIANIARFGAVFGPLLGGALTQRISWRWVFLINVPIGAATAFLIFFIRMPERKDKENLMGNWKDTLNALDLGGFAIFAPSCIMALLALEWGGTRFPWGSATIIGLFLGSLAILCLFLAWEYRRKDSAMIPLKMLSQQVIWSGVILQMLQLGALVLLTYYLPIWFQAAKGANPIDSGLMTLPSIISQIICGVATGWLVSKIGYFTPFAILGCATTTIGAGLMTTWTPSTDAGQWIGYQVLMGGGRGLASQMSLTAVQFALPKSQVSLGTSLLTFSANFGGALFVAIGQTAFTNLLFPALATFAPSVDPQAIINAGATNVGSVTSPDNVQGVIQAYNQALTKMFYIAAAASAASVFFCFGLGWGNIKKKKAPAAANV